MNCSAELLRTSGNQQWLTRKRVETIAVNVDKKLIDIRDQQPLYPGKTHLENGWTFERLVQELNERVFFWPGKIEGPISYGQRHYERYINESPKIMRVKTEDLFNANASTTPQFCKYNSGSPRTTQGRGSPRGNNTFVECHRAEYTVSNVVEVTFLHSIKLPQTIEVSDRPDGPWKSH
jgi:hypothetical protein